MEITVVNNNPSTGTKVPCVDGTAVAPGGRHVMSGRSKAEVVYQETYADSNKVIVLSKIEGADRAPVVCVMKSPSDPAGTVHTLAAVGFDLKTESGAVANVNPAMMMGVFDDEDCQTPAAHANLNTATTGTIVNGAASNIIEVTPTAAGVFACSVNDSVDEAVYLKAWVKGTAYVVDSSDYHKVTFTA